MPFPLVDRQHCYECGEEGVKYNSIYPLEPIFGVGPGMINRGEGHEGFEPMKCNGDFNVCAPCYIDQWGRMWPNEPVPAKLLMNIKIDAIQEEYRIANEIEMAEQIIAKYRED